MSETGSERQQKEEDELQPEVEIDRDLDRELENKSRQHNLTSANVRSIIHVSVNYSYYLLNVTQQIYSDQRFDVIMPTGSDNQ